MAAHLLCAANHARNHPARKRLEICSTHGTEPRNPVSLHIFDVSAKREGLVSRGDRKPYLVSWSFCLRRQTAAIPSPGERRLRRRRRQFPESFIKALPEQRPCAPATESAFRSFAAQVLTACSSPPQHGTSMRTMVTLLISFRRRISVSFHCNPPGRAWDSRQARCGSG